MRPEGPLNFLLWLILIVAAFAVLIALIEHI